MITLKYDYIFKSYKRLSGNFVVFQKRGRGHWTVYYTSPQSIIITFLLLKNYFVKSTEIKYVLLKQMFSTKIAITKKYKKKHLQITDYVLPYKAVHTIIHQATA